MVNETKIRAEIRKFIIDNFLLGDAAEMPADSESFLENGTIDSTGVLEVVMFLESRYGFKIEDRELLPENIDSLDNQVRFVLRKVDAS